MARAATASATVPPSAPRRLRLAILLALAACAACASEGLVPQPRPLSANERETYARRALEDARAYVAQERWDAAERATAHGLRLEPDNAELHRLRARVLHELERDPEASEHARRADELAPPPPHLPTAPLELSAADVLVALLPPHPDRFAGPGRVPEEWPEGEVADTLERRLRTRLPGASLAHHVPETLPGARRWLEERAPRAVVSLRVDRAYCDSSQKDGEFAVAWIRVASARAGGAASEAELVRETVSEPRMLGGCRREAVARGLERVLGLAQVRAALAAPPPAPGPESWSAGAVRQLFPELVDRVQEELDAGRELLARGRVAEAEARFQRAVEIDPESVDASSYLEEARLTLEVSGQLAATSGARASDPAEPDPGTLEPQWSASQRRAAEERLGEEQRRRDELLAALAMLEEDRVAPPAELLATLRPMEPRDSGPGLALARERAGGNVEARALYAPDGTVLAVYYFAARAPRGSPPVLREEDTRERGRPDRWIGYQDGVRRDVFEDTQDRGSPDLHLVFADGGHVLERIEIDADGDARPERVFRYAEGRLRSESRDTNGDGRLDRTEVFGADGRVELRSEDLNGDGDVDVRTTFRNGRIVRREVLSPDLVENL